MKPKDIAKELGFKNRVVSQFILKKEMLFKELTGAQKAQLKDAQADDIDFADNYESPTEQIAEEAVHKTGPIEFLSKELARLKNIRTDIIHTQVAFGSLVHTNVSWFLICSAQEQFIFDDKKFMGISEDAPLYNKIKGLKKKGQFHFGDIEYIILDIL